MMRRWLLWGVVVASIIGAGLLYLVSQLRFEAQPDRMVYLSAEGVAPEGGFGLSVIRIDNAGLPGERVEIGVGVAKLGASEANAPGLVPLQILFPAPPDAPKSTSACEGMLMRDALDEAQPQGQSWSGELRCGFPDGAVKAPAILTRSPLALQFQGGKMGLEGGFAERDVSFDEDGALIVGTSALITGMHELRALAPEALDSESGAPQMEILAQFGDEARLGLTQNLTDGGRQVFFPHLGWFARMPD